MDASDNDIFQASLVITTKPKGCSSYSLTFRSVLFLASNPLQITSVCSRRLGAEQSYGYLMSPGFPQFYVAPHHSQKCNWTIQGRLGQTVTVNVLDVRLRPTLKRGFSGVTSTHMNTAQSLNNAVSGTNPSEVGLISYTLPYSIGLLSTAKTYRCPIFALFIHNG